MPKRKNYRSKGGRNKKKSCESNNAHKREENYDEWVYTNQKFIFYYKAQNIVPEEEWASFMKHLATALPTTFRINNSCAFAERIRQRIDSEFKFDGLYLDGEKVDPISNMSWYPEKRGFQWSVERRKIRSIPLLSDFQKWLVQLSDAGSITRQEAVSMIPPLILGVEPHHKILDMCAAPGSKTSQLLELLHDQESIVGKLPTGIVIANDVDIKRSYMLVHQAKRIGSPALLVTCHEAQNFPYLGPNGSENNGYFDRILCDAPCSGDGTLRKNPVIWKQWDAHNGMTLHPLQLQIAKRGASLLKVGGFMCYSTCTFNPIENEAIVAELLRWSQGALELVDVSDYLPHLKRRNGISSWKVIDSSMKELNSFEEAMDGQSERKAKVTETMFPPSEAEAAMYHLEKCMRCVPHDENTGGFFICLLKKSASTPIDISTDENSTKQSLPLQIKDPKGKLSVLEKRTGRRTPKGEEYVEFRIDQWKQIQKFYTVSSTLDPKQLLTRSDESKTVTFVTKSITMDLLEEMKKKRVKVVYTGIKMFERNETNTGEKLYRLCQSGSHVLLPHMSSRIIRVSSRDFQILLEKQGKLLSFDLFTPPTQEAFEKSSIGTLVCLLDRTTSCHTGKMLLNVVVWRGRSSINTMAAKADSHAILSTMRELNIFDESLHKEIIGINYGI